ncbi:MAG TPA: hypothetical protein VI699_06715 [Candidatus Acidoferrales bacterium]|nr:hypothetical protein [Candidatus Acidoferrales bacterium]
MMNRVHHQDGELRSRPGCGAPRGDGLLRLLQHSMNGGHPPQAGHANLVRRPPQRGPTLAYRVAPAVHLFPALLGLGHPPIPLGGEQRFDGTLELLQDTLLDLLPGLLEQIPQC